MFFGKNREEDSEINDYLFVMDIKTQKIAKYQIGKNRPMENYQGAWIRDNGISVIEDEYEKYNY